MLFLTPSQQSQSTEVTTVSKIEIITSSSAIAEIAQRTSYFDSQNCKVEFLSHPFGGLGET